MEEEDAFNEAELVGFGFTQDLLDEQLLNRASHRLSEMLPKKLRFSESWAVKRVQLKGNTTYRKDMVVRGSESGPLKVYVRLRPAAVKTVGSMAADKMEVAIRASSDTELALEPPANAKRVLKPLPTEHFTFTKVFACPTTQQHYFDSTTLPLVEDMLSFKYKNSVVVAYGSSGAGKTYTIEGPQDDPGVLPRAVHAIFQSLEQQQSQHSRKRVLISFYEVYNDLVYDLLSGTASNGSGTTHAQSHQWGHSHQPTQQSYQQLHMQHMQPHQQQQQQRMGQGAGGNKGTNAQPAAGGSRNVLRVREDGNGRVCIPGLSEVPCSHASEALELHKRAARMRQQACTGVNSASSRSHCIFTVKLEESAESGSSRASQLSFVDLAGSERLGRTKNTGNRLKESLAINGSLMVLGRCLEALKCNQMAPPGAPQRIIPFRESKITHLFKDVLQGWGKLVLSVCVSPVAGDYDETNHVLRYAALATNISMASMAPTQTQGQASTSLAAPDMRASTEDTAVPPVSTTTQSRVTELETELARVYEQLQEAEAHLVQAEAGIRDEVVHEIQDVIQELRGSYEERMTELTEQLTQKDERISQLKSQLQAALQQQPPPVCAIAPSHQDTGAAAQQQQQQQQPTQEVVMDEAKETQQQAQQQQAPSQRKGGSQSGKENRQGRRASRAVGGGDKKEQQQVLGEKEVSNVQNGNGSVPKSGSKGSEEKQAGRKAGQKRSAEDSSNDTQQHEQGGRKVGQKRSAEDASNDNTQQQTKQQEEEPHVAHKRRRWTDAAAIAVVPEEAAEQKEVDNAPKGGANKRGRRASTRRASTVSTAAAGRSRRRGNNKGGFDEAGGLPVLLE